MPSEEEFEAWRDDPVTRWIFAACRKAAEENERNWTMGAWATGQCDQLALTEYRARADAYLALQDTEYGGWLATMTEEA